MRNFRGIIPGIFAGESVHREVTKEYLVSTIPHFSAYLARLLHRNTAGRESVSPPLLRITSVDAHTSRSEYRALTSSGSESDGIRSFIAFYIRIDRGKEKKFGGCLRRLVGARLSSTRGKHISGMFRNENVKAGRREMRNSVCKRGPISKVRFPLGLAVRRR